MTETGALTPGDVRRVLLALGAVTLIVETSVALVLGLRFWTAYDYGLGKALWYGMFHSISAFNNAGFALYSSSLMDFAGDAFIILPISVAIILGGLGFLVVVELVSRATGGRGLLPRRRTRGGLDLDERRERAQELARTSTYTISDHAHRLGLREPDPAVAALPSDDLGHARPAGDRHRAVRSSRVAQPRHARADAVRREAHERVLLRRRLPPHRRVQLHRLRAGRQRRPPAHGRHDVRGRRLGIDCGRDQGHDHHRAARGGARRGPRLPRCGDAGPAHPRQHRPGRDRSPAGQRRPLCWPAR